MTPAMVAWFTDLARDDLDRWEQLWVRNAADLQLHVQMWLMGADIDNIVHGLVEERIRIRTRARHMRQVLRDLRAQDPQLSLFDPSDVPRGRT